MKRGSLWRWHRLNTTPEELGFGVTAPKRYTLSFLLVDEKLADDLCSAKSRSSVDFARALWPAIRVPRYARGNNVQKRDATLSGEDLDPCLGKDGHQGSPGCTWTKTC